MPFESVDIVTRQNKPPTATISYMRVKPKGKHASDPKAHDRTKTKPSLLIYVPTTMLLSKLTLFMLQVDWSQKKIRIVGQKQANKNTVKATAMMHALRFNFGFIPALGDDIADKDECNVFRIDEDTVEINAPDWFVKAKK